MTGGWGERTSARKVRGVEDEGQSDSLAIIVVNDGLGDVPE